MFRRSYSEKSRIFGIKAKKINSEKNGGSIFNETTECIQNIKKGNGPQLLECMTTRWRDHVGIGDAFDLNYRNSQEIKDAMKKDDLFYHLRKNLTSEKISKNKRRGTMDRYCNRLCRKL